MNEGVTQNEVYYRKVDELQHVDTKEDLLSDDQLLLVKNDSAKRTSLGTIMDKMLEQITVPQYTINASPSNVIDAETQELSSTGVLTASSDIIGRLTPGLFISVSLTGVLDKVYSYYWSLTLELTQNNQTLTYPIYTPDGVQVADQYPLTNGVFNLVFLSNVQINDTTLTGWFIPDKIHNHDDRYYLTSEIDEKVNKINTTVIPTTRGGTGAKNIVSARKNLGINPWVVVGKNSSSTITNSGYYKVLGIACDTLKSCCVKMRISSPDNVNFSFVPVEISIIIKRSSTSKSTPIVYCNTGVDYYGILSKMYLAYNASTATGNVELWYKNNSTHNMLKVSVFECSTETSTGDSDGLEYIQFSTTNTPLDAIDSSLTTVKLISDIVTERVVTETSSGLLTAEGYTKLLNTASQASLDAHIADKTNPHKVTKSQVGLGNVDNTADVDKSVKYAVGATNDSAGQNINTTYIKGLSVSGQTVTATRGDNTTFTITTQDKNVTNTLDTTSKAYLTGTTSATSNTGTQVFDTGVYLDTTAGSLVADTVKATTFTGALSGNASSASKLQTARTIALTGSVTGSGTFDGSGNLSIATTTNHTHSYAGSASVGGPANKAINDNLGQQIDSTYIKNLSISGQTLTATKGDDSTFTLTTQDKNVTNTLNTTTKAYLTGTTSATTNTGTQIFDTGVYLDTTAGSLVAGTVKATTFTGALSGNASTATKLATARTIALTGSVTGSGTFDGSGNLSIATTTNHTHSYAGSASAGGAATKAISDNAGQQIDTTYIKGLSVSGTTLTITKGDGSTSTLTTQDTNTTYGVATSTSNGLMSATDKARFDRMKYGIELNQEGQLSAYGGAIDFHYAGSTDDYTSRIIEDASGQVNVNGVLIKTDKSVTATTFVGALSGNASTATKLATARTIALTGSVTGSGTFDGSGNLSIATTLAGDLPGNASTATKATQDSAGQQITTTYIKGLSVSGTTITITKGDGSTSTITTQDTNTDTKVTNTLATTTKAYITGTTSATTNTGTQVFDTGVYLDTTAGMLTATTFKGALSGNASTATSATKATQDSAGQQINTTYIKGLSVSGTTLTITKGDGSTSTITTQDTNTDTKVTNTLATTTKAYLTGTTSATTNTGTQVFDTGVYLDTTAGSLVAGTVKATTFTGALSGNASTATKLATARTIALTGSVTGSGTFDGSGNLSIATTTNHTHSYLPLAGGTMTGTITSSKTTSTYLAGNQGATIINSTAGAGSYTMLAKMNSTNGYFTMGTYQTKYLLQYTTKATVDAETNSVTKSATLLDESGNTSFPGTVDASVFRGTHYSASARFANNQFTAGEALSANDLIILDATTGTWFKSTTARTYAGIAMIATANATYASGATVNANVGMQRTVTADTVGSLAAKNLVLIQGTLGDDGVSFTTDGTITNTRAEGKEYIRAGYLQSATSIILSGTNPQILGGSGGSSCVRTPATTDTGYMHRNIAYGTSSTPTEDATYGGSGAIYIYYS